MQEKQEMWVRSLGCEHPLEEGMSTHSSILAWRTPGIEEPGKLQSMGLQRVGLNWSGLALMDDLPQGPETQQWHELASWRSQWDNALYPTCMHIAVARCLPIHSHLRPPLSLGLVRVYDRWSQMEGGEASRSQSQADFRPNTRLTEWKC